MAKRAKKKAREVQSIVADLVELGCDPARSAASAGLTYVTTMAAAIRRRRAGRGFRYVDAAGVAISDPDELRRIRALAIPRAWTAVRICPKSNGHIQATGRDARGRKQYRYHSLWKEVRDETKFGRMIAFAEALPRVRARVARDLALTGLSREKVLAAVTQLLERTLIRVGNEEYAKQNDSFGLTTLREDHVELSGASIRFHFRGKSGREHLVDLRDRRLSNIIRKCQDLPGQELFRYVDEAGAIHPLESIHVNSYLREAAGADFSAKDFRTWYGTLLMARALRDTSGEGAPTQKNVTAAVACVALRLGNTPSVCRKAYIHPAVISRYLGGKWVMGPARGALPTASAEGLTAEEQSLLALLKDELTAGDCLEQTLGASVRAARRSSRTRGAARGPRSSRRAA
jgi:DNA topoisomerase-1